MIVEKKTKRRGTLGFNGKFYFARLSGKGRCRVTSLVRKAGGKRKEWEREREGAARHVAEPAIASEAGLIGSSTLALDVMALHSVKIASSSESLLSRLLSHESRDETGPPLAVRLPRFISSTR